MKVTLIVGAGGTGSYFIDEVVHYYNALKEKRRVIVVDGDIVEDRNLLRQGFLRQDLDKGKAKALVDRYKKIVREGITLEARDSFINSVDGVMNIIGEGKYKEITVISCVDNNMARLRLTFALYALRDKYKSEVRFIDSGNEEWFGQTITTVIPKSGTSYLEGLHKEAKERGLEGVREYVIKEPHESHIYAGIFTGNDDWVNNLTRGDHEMSCEVVTETNPQNIGTNMMAARCLLMTVSLLQRKEFTGGEYSFDAESNSIVRRNEGVKVEVGYRERLQELLDYVGTAEGFAEVYSTEVPEEVVEEPEVEEEEEVFEDILGLIEKDKKDVGLVVEGEVMEDSEDDILGILTGILGVSKERKEFDEVDSEEFEDIGFGDVEIEDDDLVYEDEEVELEYEEDEEDDEEEELEFDEGWEMLDDIIDGLEKEESEER